MTEADRYTYTFSHNGKEVSYGPYANEGVAKEAFKAAYGYLPERVIQYKFRSRAEIDY